MKMKNIGMLKRLILTISIFSCSLFANTLYSKGSTEIGGTFCYLTLEVFSFRKYYVTINPTFRYLSLFFGAGLCFIEKVESRELHINS